MQENKKDDVKMKSKGQYKNICKVCEKSLFSDTQITMCLKTSTGYNICLNCAYIIEEALGIAEFDDFDDLNDNTDEENLEIGENSSNINLPSKKNIIVKLKSMIKGQDEAIERITSIIYRNKITKNRELKSNPLLIGKSGHGKTEIVNSLFKLLNIPYVIENAKDFSESGYVGRNPIEMFTDLYNVCNNNSKLASQGVIIIDEIDKLKSSNDIGKDISGAGVVDSLLSYISGIRVPIKDKYDNVIDYVDTEDITFVFMGAFEDADFSNSLYKIRENRLEGKKSIGFNSETKVTKIDNSVKHFIADDLIKYGFSRQFVGRTSIIELRDLNESDFKDILKNSSISVYRAFRREFSSYGVKVFCSSTLQDKIVKAAIAKNCGVRGIKAVCEEAFLPALEAVENSGKDKYKSIIFKDDLLNNPLNYILK